jgi:hypothetical protein
VDAPNHDPPLAGAALARAAVLVPLAGVLVPLAGVLVPLAGVPVLLAAVPLAGVPLAGVPLAGVPLAGVPVPRATIGAGLETTGARAGRAGARARIGPAPRPGGIRTRRAPRAARGSGEATGHRLPVRRGGPRGCRTAISRAAARRRAAASGRAPLAARHPVPPVPPHRAGGAAPPHRAAGSGGPTPTAGPPGKAPAGRGRVGPLGPVPGRPGGPQQMTPGPGGRISRNR